MIQNRSGWFWQSPVARRISPRERRRPVMMRKATREMVRRECGKEEMESVVEEVW